MSERSATSLTWSLAFVLVVAFDSARGIGGPVPCTSDEQIKAWVDQLTSKNQRPRIRLKQPLQMEKGHSLPPGFDPQDQARVSDVYDKLVATGVRAFPFLIERFDDEAHSVTVEQVTSGSALNASVGWVCQDLLVSQIHPFHPYTLGEKATTRLRPQYPLPGSKKEAVEWWNKNKDKTLQEIQLEILNWMVVKEALARKDFSEAERRYLLDKRQKLVENGKPFPPAKFHTSFDIVDPKHFMGSK